MAIPLIDQEDVVAIGRKTINKKYNEPKLIENKVLHNEYYLWRWKIKRFLIDEKIIEKCLNWDTILDVFDPIIDILLKNDKISKLELRERLIDIRKNLIEHHSKYLEIHGVDKTIWMTASEHRLLHNRLRREGKCKIPSEELTKISIDATCRTEKRKDYILEYSRTEKRKKYLSERMKRLKNNWIVLAESMGHGIRLQETFVYYDKTGNLTISSGFTGCRKKIHYIDI